jgi:TRAP-type C4-dicarboxylate transport system substrate-binding protein
VKQRRLILLMIVVLISAATLSAQVIKIASLAPESTPWGQGLNRMAAEWSRITNGRVRVTIFHGGVAGDEADSIRKMRLGQIQGTVLTTAGLAIIVPETLGLSFPGIIKTDAELDFIVSDLGDQLNELFSEYGYEILAWSNAGWVNAFSTVPVSSPDDLRGLKIASGTLPEEINAAFRNLGMQPVPVASPEILSSLNSGLIDMVIYSPLGVAGYQWFGVADQMLEYRVAPFLGAILMDQRAWDRIPAQYHEELKASVRRIGTDIAAQLSDLETDARDLMLDFGLNINEPSASERQQWDRVFAEQADVVGSDFLENDFMEDIIRQLEAFRR